MTAVAEIRKWNPKRWRPEYDRIVAYSVLGKSNTFIATQLGFTKEYVSVILNLPEAQDRYNKLAEKIRGKVEDTIADNLAYVAKKTSERLRLLVDSDEFFDKNPLGVIDRGMDVLKGLNHLKSGGNGSNGVPAIGTLIVTGAQKSDIMAGFDKIAEIRKLHGKSE